MTIAANHSQIKGALWGKTCSKCKEMKPLNAFAKDKYHGDGLKTRCRSCRNDDQRQYWQARLQRQQEQPGEQSDKTARPRARRGQSVHSPAPIATLPAQYPSAPMDMQLYTLVGELRAEIAHLKSAPSLAPGTLGSEPSPFSVEEMRKLRQDILSLKSSLEKVAATGERQMQVMERQVQATEKFMQAMRDFFGPTK